MMRQSVFRIVSVFGLIGFSVGCGSRLPTSEGARQQNQPVLSERLSFELPDSAGGTFRLEDYRGRAVLIQFFSNVCKSCEAEAKKFEEHLVSRSDGFLILGIAVKNTVDQIQKWREKVGVTYPLLLDPDGSLFNRLKITDSVPTLVFLDPEHRVRYVQNYSIEPEEALEKLQALQAGEEILKEEKEEVSAEAEVTLFVRDMCDGACAEGVRQALLGTPGIAEVRVSPEEFEVWISFDSKIQNLESLIEIIQNMGYTPIEKTGPVHLKAQEFELTPIMDPEKTQFFADDLQIHPEILKVKIDRLQNRIQIIYLPDETPIGRLIEILKQEGYDAKEI